jgi:virginiamycin A acetyltransferase
MERRIMGLLLNLYKWLKPKNKIEAKEGIATTNNNQLRNASISSETVLGSFIEIQKNSYIGGKSKIGSYTYIGFNCFITKTDIGRYVSIGNNVSIGQGEHDLDAISNSGHFYENNLYDSLTKADCVIGNDVWIGVQSIILRGVKIGNGAVIGANSTVTKDIPDFAVAVGSPARVIRYKFDQEKQEKVKQSKWWDFDLEEAKKIIQSIK